MDVKVLFLFHQKLYMKYLVILFSLLVVETVVSQTTEKIQIKKGRWLAALHLNEHDILPFELSVEKVKSGVQFVVLNGEERIILEAPTFVNDSIHLRFPFFNSELVFKLDSKKNLSGHWQNFNKGNYIIPLTAEKSKESRFMEASSKEVSANVDGRWKVAFEPGTTSEYPAVGIFNQSKENVTGTFLTETGDYRFLAGNTYKDSLFLSCFDGSHAFLFKAKMEDDSLKGTFFSGSHWQSDWTAHADENFELTSPEDLTYVKEGVPFAFDVQNLSGENVSFPNSSTEGKVVIIQIMGSWCPNCLDETMYYKTLSELYKDRGLEIISVCYEVGDSFEEYVKSIERLKTRLDLDFTFLVGGSARKDLASEQFDMLNAIISFPTSIFIGRNGEVERVHTGFNGPGTGSYYTDYVKTTNALVEFLLAQ